MATLPSLKELRAMQPADLQKEVNEQLLVANKLRLAIKLQAEKDSAKLRRIKKLIARGKTILNEKKGESSAAKPLKKKAKIATVSAPSKA